MTDENSRAHVLCTLCTTGTKHEHQPQIEAELNAGTYDVRFVAWMTTTTLSANKVPVSGRRRQLVRQPVTNPRGPWAWSA